MSSAELLAWELSKIRVKPVKVGLGIARLSKGFESSNPGFLCLPSSLLVDGTHALARLSLGFGFAATKTDRKAVNDNIITATQASNCCQMKIHVLSNLPWKCIPAARMMAIRIILMLRHKNAPTPIFWLGFIRTRQSKVTGIITTAFCYYTASKQED